MSKGGLVPLVLLVHELGEEYPVGVFNIKNMVATPSLYHKVLVIDDIIDTGETLGKVNSHYLSEGKDFKMAALFRRYSSQAPLDVYCAEEIKVDNWLVFPWEV